MSGSATALPRISYLSVCDELKRDGHRGKHQGVLVRPHEDAELVAGIQNIEVRLMPYQRILATDETSKLQLVMHFGCPCGIRVEGLRPYRESDRRLELEVCCAKSASRFLAALNHGLLTSKI